MSRTERSPLTPPHTAASSNARILEVCITSTSGAQIGAESSRAARQERNKKRVRCLACVKP